MVFNHRLYSLWNTKGSIYDISIEYKYTLNTHRTWACINIPWPGRMTIVLATKEKQRTSCRCDCPHQWVQSVAVYMEAVNKFALQSNPIPRFFGHLRRVRRGRFRFTLASASKNAIWKLIWMLFTVTKVPIARTGRELSLNDLIWYRFILSFSSTSQLPFLWLAEEVADLQLLVVTTNAALLVCNIFLVFEN